jgi:hypothetical protein
LIGSDLWADFQHRNDRFEAVRDAKIISAKCKSKVFVISFCDVKAQGPNVAGPGVAGNEREFNYFILGGLGDEGVGLRRAAGDGPAADRHLTTTIGIEYLTTRIVSYLVLMGFLGALAFAPLLMKGDKSKPDSGP